jgi:hypothetical protein
MSIDITRAKVLRFQNYWLLHNEFMQVMQHGWNIQVTQKHQAKKMVAKLKKLREFLEVGTHNCQIW